MNTILACHRCGMLTMPQCRLLPRIITCANTTTGFTFNPSSCSQQIRTHTRSETQRHRQSLSDNGLGYTGLDTIHRRLGIDTRWYQAVCKKLNLPMEHRLMGARLYGTHAGGRDWSRAMSEAEKIVGYPTSFMSLRCLLSDEISNLAIHMRKLVGSKHPIVDAARRFIYDGTHSLQMRGLLVLLVAKAAGPAPRPNSDVMETMVSGIYPSQRSLAEITEMIHTAYLVHKGVVDLDVVQAQLADMQFGNKMSVLTGDFLLASASTALAQLYNTEVVELVSGAIGDIASAEFTSMCAPDGSHVLPATGASVQQWEQQAFLSAGSLLAKSCKAVMILAQHSHTCQHEANELGRQMGFAYQLHEELSILLQRPGYELQAASPASVPIILHLQTHPQHSQLLSEHTGKPGNSSKICDILHTSDSIAQAQNKLLQYREVALRSIGVFGDSDASSALVNIVNAVTHV